MMRPRLLFVSMIIVALAAPTESPVAVDRFELAASSTKAARIVRVSDGDTVVVRMASSGKERRVRLIGIDTPEVYNGTECGGKAASKALKARLPVGTKVKLVRDYSQANQDRYERLLRYVVKRKTGNDMGRKQLRDGHAEVYVYNGVKFNRYSSYKSAENQAKAGNRGIWKNCR